MRRDVANYASFTVSGHKDVLEKPPGEPMPRMTRGIHLLCLLVCSVSGQVLSQHPQGSLGPAILRTLPGSIGDVLRVERDSAGSEMMLVSSPDGRFVWSIQVPWDGPARILDTLDPRFSFRMLPVSGSAREEKLPILLLRLDSLAMYELDHERSRGWSLTKLTSIDRVPSTVHIADLNSDDRFDMLVADEQEPGIVPFYRTSEMKWRRGRLIAPDLPVGEFATLHLNNDGLLDILVYDWVRSEIHLVYGVGRDRFLDQGGFTVDGTVTRMFVDPVTAYHPLRVTFFDRIRSSLSYREMDERGDLVEVSSQLMVDSVRSVYTVRDDSTFRSMFILVSDSTVGLIRDAFIAQNPSVSTVGLAGKVTAAVRSSDASLSLVLDSALYCHLWTYDGPWQRGDSLFLATPLSPVAVIIRDQNGDGWDDMTFVGGETGTLSFVWGHGNGSFSGAEDFDGPEHPRTAIGQEFSALLTRLYSAHDDPPSLSVTELEWQDQTVTTSRIPLQGVTELIGEVRASSGATSLSAIHRLADDVTFATYERIRQDSFLEQTINLGKPSVLFGASFGFVDADSLPDAILIYRPDDSSAVTLSISYGDTVHSDERLPVGRSIPVRDPRVTYVWQTDANNDDISDLILIFPRTAREIYLMLSTADTLYAQSILIDSAIVIEERQHVAILDVNGDSLPDVFAVVPARGGLGWWKNTGGGSFAAWELLVQAPDITGFALGHLYSATGYDLMVTRQKLNGAVLYRSDIPPWGRP